MVKANLGLVRLGVKSPEASYDKGHVGREALALASIVDGPAIGIEYRLVHHFESVGWGKTVSISSTSVASRVLAML